MGNERYVNYQWVENGLFELSERYGEQALRLIQDADADEETFLAEFIEDIIKEHIEKIESLINRSAPKASQDALIFKKHERGKIPKEYLQVIVPLAEKFRDKVIAIVRSKEIIDRMEQSDYMINGVKRCLIDMRERVHALFEEF